MKIFILITAILILTLSATVMMVRPVLVTFAKKKIEHGFPGNTISVKEINLYYTPWSLLRLKATGEVLISKFQHDKFKAQNIKVNLRWDGGCVYLDALTGEIFNGTVKGNGKLTLGSPPHYIIDLNFANLDLTAFDKDFELNHKVEMDGKLNGYVTLNGNGQSLGVLNGSFKTPSLGGNVTIKDVRFLESMALNAKLPVNVVVDSFKDYHYNIGLVEIILNHGDLDFNINLEGSTGKRNLKIVVHDFNLN